MKKKGVINFNVKWIVILIIVVIFISIIATVLIYKIVVKNSQKRIGDASSGTLRIDVKDSGGDASGKLNINVVD